MCSSNSEMSRTVERGRESYQRAGKSLRKGLHSLPYGFVFIAREGNLKHSLVREDRLLSNSEILTGFIETSDELEEWGLTRSMLEIVMFSNLWWSSDP